MLKTTQGEVTMKIKPIPVIAIAICSIVAVRQVMWEFRPQVVPNTIKIIADLHNNIGVFVNRDAVYPHQFKDMPSESPYLFSITDLDAGDTPALNFNMVGQLFIAAKLDDLHDPSKLEAFRILCQSAAALKNGRESKDFDAWLAEAIDGSELSLHRDVGFTATNYTSDYAIEITLLPR
jgi:hypothetical protein